MTLVRGAGRLPKKNTGVAATLNVMPSIPAIGLVLVPSVDWFIGMARALGDLIGNCVAAGLGRELINP